MSSNPDQEYVINSIPFTDMVVNFLNENTALYRHYAIEEVKLNVSQFVGVNLTHEQTITLVQSMRDKQGLGPIKAYNMPGYEEEE